MVIVKMSQNFFEYRFSTHFNHLTYLGMWSADMVANSTAKKIYLLYCLIPHSILFTAVCLQMMDLYFVIGNLRKVTFNFSTSAIVLGYTIKMMLLYDRKDHLNKLRLNLWEDSLKLKDEENVSLLNDAYEQLKYIKLSFYVGCLTILPVMIISSYFSYMWGPRELPFAGYFPMSDPLNDYIYVPALIWEAVCAFYVIAVVIEAELSMFSVVLQLDAFYKILIQKIYKLNLIYADHEDEFRADEENKTSLKAEVEESVFKREVNVYLKKEVANRLLKLAVIRHLKLIEYTERCETIYSRCMFLHAFAASLLIVMNGIELSLYSEISIKLGFQIGFITMVVMDLLFICYYLSRLSIQCNNVGNAAYSTFWYKMDPDTRKKLMIIIMRSRKPPRITGGKFFLMDLQTYLHILSNIYSWLMLMRRVIAK